MPGNERQYGALAEIVVKEAVEKGMDSPMRETIVEAVEGAGGTKSSTKRTLPLAGAFFGLGAALGYLAGQQKIDLEGTPFEDMQGTQAVDEVTSGVEEVKTGVEEMTSGSEETAAEADTAVSEGDAEMAPSSRRLPRLLLALVALAGALALRRRLSGDDEDGWEPIEEFEPATSVGSEEDEAEAETTDDEDETESSEDEAVSAEDGEASAESEETSETGESEESSEIEE